MFSAIGFGFGGVPNEFHGRTAAALDLHPRTPYRQSIHLQGRLSHAHRHALPVLAAGADAGVEFEVVAHHADAGQDVRAVADQGGALDRAGDPAVLDQVRLARREHELAGGDVHLTAAEVLGV